MVCVSFGLVSDLPSFTVIARSLSTEMELSLFLIDDEPNNMKRILHYFNEIFGFVQISEIQYLLE